MSPERITQLAGLLQLASPALPVGAFSYSQGLEAAVDAGLLRTPEHAAVWLEDGLLGVMARAEAPLWVLQYRAWAAGDDAALAAWNDWFLATRESRELRQETEQMGWSLAQLARQLGWGGEGGLARLAALRPLALPSAHAYAACMLGLPLEEALTAYCYSWIENQVAAALKAVPLGQVAGQRLLAGIRPALADAVGEAIRRADAEPPELSTFSPQLALLSARHETQYSRLFRS